MVVYLWQFRRFGMLLIILLYGQPLIYLTEVYHQYRIPVTQALANLIKIPQIDHNPTQPHNIPNPILYLPLTNQYQPQLLQSFYNTFYYIIFVDYLPAYLFVLVG